MEYSEFITLKNNNIYVDDYRINMIVKNNIEGLLRMYISLVDGNVEISYDTEYKVNLQDFYQNKKFNYIEIKTLLQSIVTVSNTIKRYLLKADDILFDINYIYRDKLDLKFYFCYMPANQNDLCEHLRNLIQEIMLLTDHTDYQAVELIYEVLHTCENSTFHISRIEEILNHEYGKKDIEIYHTVQEDTFYSKVSEIEQQYQVSEQNDEDKKSKKIFHKIARVLKGE